MTNLLLNDPVTRVGTGFLGVVRPWAPTVSGTGLSHVRTTIPDSAVVFATRMAEAAVTPQIPAIERPLAVKAELPLPLVDNRKQYVHMTRVNAGGDGASGPHPEREPV